jgi:hypothetical protein
MCSQALLDEKKRADFELDIKDQYTELREDFYASLEDRKYLTLPEARAKGPKVSPRRLLDDKEFHGLGGPISPSCPARCLHRRPPFRVSSSRSFRGWSSL